jgi:hypothetical protein
MYGSSHPNVVPFTDIGGVTAMGMGGVGAMANMSGYPMMGLGSTSMLNRFIYSGSWAGLAGRIQSLTPSEL